MKNKKVFIYIFMVLVFALALFMLFRTNTTSFKRLSASISPEEEKNIIIEKAKLYINDHIDKFDGKDEIKIKDLIMYEYLTDEEIKEVTKDLYNEETRIFFEVNKYKITDIYLKDELFSKLFRCSDVCYINDENNYIYYNNEQYQILRVDSNGNVYITNNETKKVNPNNIETILRNKANELDRNISDSVDLITSNDIKYSEFLKVERDVLVSSSIGYKVYSIDLDELSDIDTTNIDTMFVIKILNTVNYKMGDGTTFNPYVVSE
jgi:hypothetical protein